MRFIPTTAHGALDYLVGVLLIAAPWVLGFADGGAEQWVPVALGAGLILYSAITDYELSLANILPLPLHLGLDLVSGVFLAASPWLFGFSEEVWLPHVVVGVIEIGTALMTHTVRDDETTRGREVAGRRERRMA